MKRVLTFLLAFSSVIAFSQAITVNTSTYTVPQLVNDVLINSPCITATNITWSTGTNFGSSNGIGYFTNTNPNFPMTSGVILSTGDVMAAPGPNTTIQSAGNSAWTGDASLEATLAAAGIPMVSTNATTLEFEFVPLSPHFDFNFLFASEEYGNFQCQFSDAFAFLLTNMSTGVTTNLAVVPATTDPISVVSIRDNDYNSACPSANANYFGTYNGGSNAAGSATNFNGQTVVMNASSVLTPGVQYKIKLVIADRGDYQGDSAIFLASNSFNIGQNVLGNGYTIANNNAICFGGTQLLDTGLDPALYTFVWKRNNVVIAGQTGPTYLVTQPGTYSVTYTNIAFPCQTITNTVVVEYYPQYITPNPINLYKCNNGSSTYVYDLTTNTPIVTTGLAAGTSVAYFSTLTDANSGTNALATNYTSAGNETIYVRITNPTTGCSVVKSFQLLIGNVAVANQPPTFYACANANGSGTFNLTTLNSTVLGTQSSSIYSVSYYLNATDANLGTNPITTNTLITTGTTIYIRVQLTSDPTCFATTSVNLVVVPQPLIDSVQDVITCADYTLPPLTNGNYYNSPNGVGLIPAGTVITETQTIYVYNSSSSSSLTCHSQSSFQVIIIKVSELDIASGNYCEGYTLPVLHAGAGEYHTAPNGGGTIIPGGTVLTVSQTVYYYFTTTTPISCLIDVPFSITIIPAPAVPQLSNVFDCTSYTLQPLTVGDYYTAPNGGGTLLTAGTVITSSQQIYIYAIANGCPKETNFHVVIGTSTFPIDENKCINFTLPVLLVGNYYTAPNGGGTIILAGTIINSSQTIYVYAASQSLPNCSANYSFNVVVALPPLVTPPDVTQCGSYTLPPLTVGNYYTETHIGGSGGTMLNAGYVVKTTKTIYIYQTNNNGCTNETFFNVTIKPLPVISVRADVEQCNSYTLTNLSKGNYYTQPNGGGSQLTGGTVITSTQTIYIYAELNGCTNQTSFTVTIHPIQAQQLSNVTVCDSYILPTLTGTNRYFTATGGTTGGGTELFAGQSITTSQTIFVFNETGERFNCTDEKTFTVTVNTTPILPPFSKVTACRNYTLPALTLGNYFTAPNGGGTMLHANDVLTNNQTVYVYAETATTPNCYDEKSFTVSIYKVDVLPNVTECTSYVLPTLSVGNYFTATNGGGTPLSAGTSITTTQPIFIYGTSGFTPNCSDENTFTVTIVGQPIANPVPIANTTICDTDGTNDGNTNFNLATLSPIVLGTQTGPEFTITYYNSLADATSNLNAMTNTTSHLVYVKVVNTLAPNCYDIKPITIIVNKLPEPTPHDGIVCINSQTGALLNPYVINSGLSSAVNTINWYDSQHNLIHTGSNYIANQAGVYSVIATNNTTGCVSNEVFVTVTASEPPSILTYTINEYFANDQTLTIATTGSTGIYEYQLDNGLFQLSPVFNNVPSGMHTVTVRDTNGCGVSSTIAYVVNYPHFFTPNGDGYNDYWNIYDLREQSFSYIYIFDRFGKLLKEIKPSGPGWDGTYNGHIMPSDDYWFTIKYLKNGIEGEFKAHFAMKR